MSLNRPGQANRTEAPLWTQVSLVQTLSIRFGRWGCQRRFVGGQCREIVRPVRADSRAAVRISVTMRLFSSEERPDGGSFRRATAVRYEIESRSSGRNSLGSTVSSAAAPGLRTRSEFPPVAMA